MKVYPFGYSMPNAAQALEALMSDATMLLIDTRYSPYAPRNPEWNGEALKEQWGQRYRFAGQCLGNVNYKQHGNIKIADPVKGIHGLRMYLAEGHDLVLLCTCKEYEACHRKVIVDLLLNEEPGVEVIQQEASPLENTSMLCLSIRQPYASWFFMSNAFIDAGVPPKTIENRDWTTKYRGRVAIHAGVAFEEAALDCWATRFPALGRIVPKYDRDYPRGIIGTADLVDVIERSADPWFCGKYGFVFENCAAFKKPVPYRGQLKLFPVPLLVLSEVQ